MLQWLWITFGLMLLAGLVGTPLNVSKTARVVFGIIGLLGVFGLTLITLSLLL